MIENETVYYHWLSHDRKLRYGDGRVANDGETITVNGRLKLCESGLHASRKMRDAAGYAGMVNWSADGYAVFTEVRLGDDAIHGHDKSVSSSRTVVRSVRVHISVLVEYARWCADRVSHYRSANAAVAHAAAADNAAAVAHAAAAYNAAEKEAQEQWWRVKIAALFTASASIDESPAPFSTGSDGVSRG